MDTPDTPAGETLSERIAAGVDLRGVTLADLRTAGVDLTGADLTDLLAAQVELTGATLADLLAAQVDLRGTTTGMLTDAGIDLRGVTLDALVAASIDRTDATLDLLVRAGIDLAGTAWADLPWRAQHGTLSELVTAGIGLRGVSLAELADAGIELRSAQWADLADQGIDLRGLAVDDLVGLGIDLSDTVWYELAAAGIPPLPADVPEVPDLHQQMAEAVGTQGEYLAMHTWHRACGTRHCRAGWAVVLAGEAGWELERWYGTATAATMIYLASDPDYPLPCWHQSDADALASIQEAASRATTD